MNGTDFEIRLQGLDIGDKSITEFSKVIATAKTVIWNG
jgi:3-phosphoglycerate kinase